MDLIESIDKYRCDLEKNPYSCLFFALQLPNICSRIEYPSDSLSDDERKEYYNNGRPLDGKLYKKWIKDHYSYFNEITKFLNISCDQFGDALYDLRCDVAHEGVIISIDKLFNTTSDIYFCFIDDYDPNKMTHYGLGNVRFLPIREFCNCMFDAACTTDIHIISPFSTIYASYSDYNALVTEYRNMCYDFLDDYSDDDVLLINIYDLIKLRRPDLLSDINLFFKQNPDGVYNYRSNYKSNFEKGHVLDFSWDVGWLTRYSSTNILVFEKAYDVPYIEGAINMNPTVTNLILTGDQYNRMKLIRSKYLDFKERARQSLIKQKK